MHKTNKMHKSDKGSEQELIATYFPEAIRRLPQFEGCFAANRLSADGCDVLFATYPAGTDIPPHSHPTENVGLTTRGRMLLSMNGKTQEYGPGDWYHIPANCEHAANFPEATANIELWFHR